MHRKVSEAETGPDTVPVYWSRRVTSTADHGLYLQVTKLLQYLTS